MFRFFSYKDIIEKLQIKSRSDNRQIHDFFSFVKTLQDAQGGCSEKVSLPSRVDGAAVRCWALITSIRSFIRFAVAGLFEVFLLTKMPSVGVKFLFILSENVFFCFFFGKQMSKTSQLTY